MDLNDELFQRAQISIPGGVNSPVRAFRSVGGSPRFIDRAKGPYMWDATGKQFIDYILSWGPMILGHNTTKSSPPLTKPSRRASPSAPSRRARRSSPKRSASSCRPWTRSAS